MKKNHFVVSRITLTIFRTMSIINTSKLIHQKNCVLTDKPSIEKCDFIVVNETDRVLLTREISSNPLANVSWYDGQQLLKSEIAVSTTTFIIEKTRCTDTKNFTLIASNALQINVTSFAELIVNCKYYKLLFHTKLKYIFKQTFKHIFP